jgi:hypothetical protein
MAGRLGRRGNHVVEILKAQSPDLIQDAASLGLREQPGERRVLTQVISMGPRGGDRAADRR